MGRLAEVLGWGESRARAARWLDRYRRLLLRLGVTDAEAADHVDELEEAVADVIERRRRRP